VTWSNESGLRGCRVVVTGAAGGIGAAVCNALAEAGAHVDGVDRDPQALNRTIDALPDGMHRALCADLSDISSHAGLLSDERMTAPPLAAVIHLAAVLRRRESVDDVTEDDWDTQLDLNLKATFFLNRAACHAFRRQGTGGSIVNFTSQGWMTGGFGGSVVYAASKGGVVSLTKGLARSFATYGVRVNAVAPGGIETPMMVNDLTKDELAQFVSQIPLSRLGDPAEVTGAVMYLASSASSYVTGSVLNVSGGQLMY
jgi:NAD(P)-dependent dehydrogenase (short-subunit alcohol dehydrogenase family)